MLYTRESDCYVVPECVQCGIGKIFDRKCRQSLDFGDFPFGISTTPIARVLQRNFLSHFLTFGFDFGDVIRCLGDVDAIKPLGGPGVFLD